MTDKTITRAEADALRQAAWDANGCRQRFDDALVQQGYRIIDDAPPEGVVKLAREIAERTDRECFNSGVMADASDYAIAVIMHARKAVEAAQPWTCEVTGDVYVCQRDILRELGGNDD